MANSHEASGQNVKQKTAQKVIGVKRQQALLVVMSGVSKAEGDFSRVEGDQTVIGDGNTVGVGA
jgi:hypothetical protein